MASSSHGATSGPADAFTRLSEVLKDLDFDGELDPVAPKVTNPTTAQTEIQILISILGVPCVAKPS
jgi:hypothetical protein